MLDAGNISAWSVLSLQGDRDPHAQHTHTSTQGHKHMPQWEGCTLSFFALIKACSKCEINSLLHRPDSPEWECESGSFVSHVISTSRDESTAPVHLNEEPPAWWKGRQEIKWERGRWRRIERMRHTYTHCERGWVITTWKKKKKKKGPSLPESLDNLAIQRHSVTLCRKGRGRAGKLGERGKNECKQPDRWYNFEREKGR